MAVICFFLCCIIAANREQYERVISCLLQKECGGNIAKMNKYFKTNQEARHRLIDAGVQRIYYGHSVSASENESDESE